VKTFVQSSLCLKTRYHAMTFVLYFKCGAACMVKSNRDSTSPSVTIGCCDHVNHNKFCEDVNWTRISTFNLPCFPKNY